jgi:hypothetical protein
VDSFWRFQNPRPQFVHVDPQRPQRLDRLAVLVMKQPEQQVAGINCFTTVAFGQGNGMLDGSLNSW